MHRRSNAHAAHRSAAMLHRLAAHLVLAEGRRRCDACPRRRALVLAIVGRTPAPHAAIVAARTMPLTPEHGARVSDDEQQRRTDNTAT